MTTQHDVLRLFEQLYQAEQQLAINAERERVAVLHAQNCRVDREEAERQLASLRERMQLLARKAAGIPEPEAPAEVRPFGEYRPVRGEP